MPFYCVECKPCSGARALFKCPRPTTTFRLRRAFGRIMTTKVGAGRRRRGAGSFSSVRAVFWPLMSMRSDADDRPPPSASTDDAPGAAASMTTAARVLALQARLGEGAASPMPPPPGTATAGATARRSPSPARDDDDDDDAASTTTTAARVLALRTGRLGSIGAQAARGDDDVDDRDDVDVEEACRCFEKHLTEMLVDERKVVDLMDVEELLRCWEELRSPVFVQLVGRFYGELCMDLFFSDRGDAVDASYEEQGV